MASKLDFDPNSAVAIAYQYATQAKVADFIVQELAEHDIRVDPIAVDSFEEITALGLGPRLLDHDIVLSTLGGRQTVALAKALRENQLAQGGRRPLLASMNVGVILNHVYYGTFMFREGADIVFVNRESDVARIRDFYASLGGTPPEIVAVRCPIFNDLKLSESTVGTPQSLLYSVQTDIPRTKPERTYVAQRLADYARTHPTREVILKPKVAPGEQTAHPQKFAFEDILETLPDGLPANLTISYEPMRELIERTDLLVSFSSTAVLEALALGRRAAVMIDFGVREILGSTYFIGSGLFASFDDLIADKVPVVDRQWLADELSAPRLSTILRDIISRAREHDATARVSSVFDRCSQLVDVVESAAPVVKKPAAERSAAPKVVRTPGGAPLWAQADRIWRDRGEGLLFADRLRRFSAINEGQRRRPVHDGEARPCLLIGTGPSARKLDPALLRQAETICANWFMMIKEFEDLKPDHLLMNARVIRNIDTFQPRLRKGVKEFLLEKTHRPVLWAPFSVRELFEEEGLDREYEINYLLCEKPFRRSIDMTGAATLDARGFLDDAHSVLLTLGVPAALQMGFARIGVAGADARFTDVEGARNYFHRGPRAAMTPERLKARMDLWRGGGRAHAAFAIVADALAARGVELIDTTKGGALTFLSSQSLADFVRPQRAARRAA